MTLIGACANSKSGTNAATTKPSVGSPNGTSPTTFGGADLTKKVPRPGVKGVTEDTIRVAVIISKTNPIGGKFVPFVDGVKAYFKSVNDQGGIYGRKLEVVATRDDIVGLQNSPQVTASLSDDNAFATFVATLQFTGADLLARAKQPTFIWNIAAEFASTPTVDHSSLFASTPALCFSCLGPTYAWVALRNGITKVGVLGYGVAASSKICAQSIRDGYSRFTNGKIKVAFFDNTIPFAGDLAADVARMKEAGVQLVNTCLDNNEVVKLQKEMKKQGLPAIQYVQNAYDHDFLRENGQLFEGSFVQPYLYPAWEQQPQSAATKQFLAAVKSVTSDPAELTEVGWIVAMEFVDGLRGAGPEFTQDKVVAWLNSQTAYSANGLIPPIDWTKGHVDPQRHPEVRGAQSCVVILRVEHGQFVPYEDVPGKPWTCLDNSKGADQTSVHRSFSPDGVG